MDSDGQHCPEDLFTLISPIIKGDADFTIGSRYLGTYHYDLPITTRLGEALIEKFIYLFFGTKIMNNQGGFRAFHRKMTHIFENMMYKGFMFTTEVILKAATYKYKIKECPIMLMDREYGTSNIVLIQFVLNLCACFIRSYFNKIRYLMLKRNKKYAFW